MQAIFMTRRERHVNIKKKRKNICGHLPPKIVAELKP